MSENENLKRQIKELQEQIHGLEMALSDLVISICASGNISIPNVAQSYKSLSVATKESFNFNNSKTTEPMDRIAGLLDVAADLIQKEQEKRKAGG